MVISEETENEFSERIIQELKKYFFVSKEVFSDCKTARIDAVIYDRTNLKRRFGIEFKRPTHKTGVFLAKFCLQAQKYTKLKFGGEELEVMICPAISNNDFVQVERWEKLDLENDLRRGWRVYPNHAPSCSHSNVNSFLGAAFNIAELRFLDHKPFIIKNNKVLWKPSNI